MLSSVEIEQIVRVVIQRLAVGRELMDGVVAVVGVPDEPTELVLTERLITTQLLEGQLNGKRTARVSERAVVTPAVVDLLRAKKIKLVRGNEARLDAPLTRSSSESPLIAPIGVFGSSVWFGSLARHLCSKQARIEACHESEVSPSITSHFANGGRQAIWITGRPFAAVAHAQQHSKLVAVQLPSLVELAAALEQVQPQLWIVDSSRWTVAAVGNLVRTLARRS